jgi:NTP pyrophosphatase (non-canonical NTP hydrolase)
MSFAQIEMKVIQWAEARRIIPNATPTSQLLKAVSEMGELCDAEGKRDQAAIEDAVGDVLVCLINYCALRDLDVTSCLEGAYEQIKDRKGTLMPDGTFVKDE